MVNFLRRYNPSIINLKKKLKNGSLGKVFNGFFWYKENLNPLIKELNAGEE